MFVVRCGCPNLAQSLPVANTQLSFWRMKRKQRASTLLVYSDKDQFLCVRCRCATFGSGQNTADWILLSIGSEVLCISTKWKFSCRSILKCDDNGIFAWFRCRPIRLKPAIILPPQQMSVHNRARTISRSWLDSLPLETSCCLQPPWKPESPWRRWWLWRSGCWPPFSWPPS